MLRKIIEVMGYISRLLVVVGRGLNRLCRMVRALGHSMKRSGKHEEQQELEEQL